MASLNNTGTIAQATAVFRFIGTYSGYFVLSGSVLAQVLEVRLTCFIGLSLRALDCSPPHWHVYEALAVSAEVPDWLRRQYLYSVCFIGLHAGGLWHPLIGSFYRASRYFVL